MATRRGWHLCLAMGVLSGSLGFTACSDDESTDSSGAGGAAAGALGDAGAATGGGGGESNEGAEAFLPSYESGSRLKAISLGEAGGSPRLLQVWFDEELATECSIARADDGEFRCLPLGQELARGFLDADCTEEAYYDTLVSPCASHPPYRREPASDDACSGTRVFAMERVETTTVYHESCEGAPTELGNGEQVWRDVEAMDATEFVLFERVERVNSEGVGVVEWQGADGSRQVTSAFHESFGSCSRRELDGEPRCTPQAAFLDAEWWFDGEACSGEQLAYNPRSNECSDPVEYALVVDVEGGGPARSYTLYTVGEAASGPVYEQGFGADPMCNERDSAELLWSLYPLEDEVDPSELPLLEDYRDGTGRARVVHHAVDGVALNTTGTFYDADRDETCRPVRLHDSDAWLCIPEDLALSSDFAFADEDCSVPVLYSEATPPEVSAPTLRDHCVREGFADRILGVYEVGDAYSGSLYIVDDTGCIELEGNQPDYYELTPITSDFVVLEEATD